MTNTPNEVRYFEFGDFKIDVGDCTLYKNNDIIPLTRKSIELLIFLVRNRGTIVEKKEFFSEVWDSSFVDESNLTQHIYRIRKVLNNGDLRGQRIETIPKLGYKFDGEVNEIFEPLEQENVLEVGELFSDQFAEPFGSETETPSSKSESEKLPVVVVEDEQDVPPTSRNFFEKRTVLGVLAGSLFAFALSYILFQSYFVTTSEQNKNQTVAVLPFKHISEKRDAILEIGVADTLSGELSKKTELNILPPESSAKYTQNNFPEGFPDIFEIGKSLGVDIIMTGTIQMEENTARFSIKYYSVPEKRQLCTAKFDEEFSDTFALQDSISEKAAKKLMDEIENHVGSPDHVIGNN